MSLWGSHFVICVVRFTSFVLRKLPLFLNLWIGKFLGRLIFLFNLKARRIAYANLRMVFSHKFSPRVLNKILKEIFYHMAMNIVEVLRFPCLNSGFIEKYTRIDGLEKIEKALIQKKGVILLTAHFGNWELSAQAASIKGFPMMVLATEQKHSRLNELLNDYRSLHGSTVVTKGFQLREILNGLKENKIAGILCDQDGGKDGIETDFLRRNATTARGPFEIAMRNNSVILPCFNVRGKKGCHTVFIGDPLKMPDIAVDKEAALKNLADEFNHLLEERIYEFPAQWLWTLKRWKSSKERAVVILSDGKAGHLNQSKAAAEIITEGLSKLGFKAIQDYQTKEPGYKIIEIKFRNKWRRILFKAAVCFLNHSSCWRERLLKFALEEKPFLEAQSCYANIFISAGSGGAGVNLLLARENMAKSVVIMKPYLPLKWFDLAIVPAHDFKIATRNEKIIEILGALVYSNRDFIESKIRELREQLELNDANCISLFIGGETSLFSYEREQIVKIVDAVKKAAADLNAKILVTTSRRTPVWLEEFLEKEFGKDARCALLLIANRSNIPDAVVAFLGLSLVAVVSGDSISMVSEIVSTDTQTIVFLPNKKKNGITKQEKFIRELEGDGYLSSAREDLKEQIVHLFSAGRKKPFCANTDKIREAVRSLI